MSSAHAFQHPYILDTNIIRSLFRYNWPPDIFPEIWTGLKELESRGLLTSIDAVKTECDRQLGGGGKKSEKRGRKNKIAEGGYSEIEDDWIQKLLGNKPFQSTHGWNDIAEDWIQKHLAIFTPSKREIEIVREILSHSEFQLSPKDISKGKTKADPFLVARGKYTGGVVVTDERYEEIGRKIPTMCKRYGVTCISRIDFIRLLRKINDEVATGVDGGGYGSSWENYEEEGEQKKAPDCEMSLLPWLEKS